MPWYKAVRGFSWLIPAVGASTGPLCPASYLCGETNVGWAMQDHAAGQQKVPTLGTWTTGKARVLRARSSLHSGFYMTAKKDDFHMGFEICNQLPLLPTSNSKQFEIKFEKYLDDPWFDEDCICVYVLPVSALVSHGVYAAEVRHQAATATWDRGPSAGICNRPWSTCHRCSWSKPEARVKMGQDGSRWVKMGQAVQQWSSSNSVPSLARLDDCACLVSQQ